MQASTTAEQLDKVYRSGTVGVSPSVLASPPFNINEEKEAYELDKSVIGINIESLAVVGEMDDTFDTHGEDAIRSIDQVIAQMPPKSKSLDAALVRINEYIYMLLCVEISNTSLFFVSII